MVVSDLWIATVAVELTKPAQEPAQVQSNVHSPGQAVSSVPSHSSPGSARLLPQTCGGPVTHGWSMSGVPVPSSVAWKEFRPIHWVVS